LAGFIAFRPWQNRNITASGHGGEKLTSCIEQRGRGACGQNIPFKVNLQGSSKIYWWINPFDEIRTLMSLSSLNIPASEHCCPGYQAFNT
jgi:hypothetical protein